MTKKQRTKAVSEPFVDSGSIRVSDILVFSTTYPKKYNKASNDKREAILETIQRCHKSFLTHPLFGDKWRHIQKQWMDSIHRLAKERKIPPYTRVEVEREGGRGSHHDFHFVYYDVDIPVGTIIIEFKNGANNINKLPQILSLQAKFPLVQETFDVYWYHHGYDKYRACDPSLKEPKPSLEEYVKIVTNVDASIHPAIQELRDQEENFKKEKKRVVDSVITKFLNDYAKTINLSAFSEKVKDSQSGKIYLLWNDGQFYMDEIKEEEMTNLVFDSIKNGNTLLLKSGNTFYHALLRWRNHQGILNPAWQIKLTRK